MKEGLYTCLVLGSVLSFCFMSRAEAANFYVNSEADLSDAEIQNGVCDTGNIVVASGGQTGQECTLRAAIEQAGANGEPDRIFFHPGVRRILLEKQLPVYENDSSSLYDVLVVGDVSIDAERNGRVLDIGPGVGLVLSGVSVTGGLVTSTKQAEGAGIRNYGSLWLYDVKIHGNVVRRDAQGEEKAAVRGAGIFNGGTGTLVSDLSEIGPRNILSASGLDADALGAGVYNAGTLSIKRNTVHHNYAYTQSAGDQGFAKSRGGALYHASPVRADIDSSALHDNAVYSTLLGSAQWARSQGSGIYMQPSTELDITNTTISRNRALGIGNAPYSFAFSHGGALYAAAYSKAYIANSTFAFNEVSTPNSAIPSGSAVGSGIFAVYAQKSDIRLKNTIISNVGGKNCNVAFESDGYNVASDTSCGLNAAGDKQSIDPALAPLAMNGGYTPTHKLSVSSPAVDGGDPAGCYDYENMLLKNDQRHKPRTVGYCDAGSFELQPSD